MPVLTLVLYLDFWTAYPRHTHPPPAASAAIAVGFAVIATVFFDAATVPSSVTHPLASAATADESPRGGVLAPVELKGPRACRGPWLLRLPFEPELLEGVLALGTQRSGAAALALPGDPATERRVVPPRGRHAAVPVCALKSPQLLQARLPPHPWLYVKVQTSTLQGRASRVRERTFDVHAALMMHPPMQRSIARHSGVAVRVGEAAQRLEL
mmetsp:Transcript_24893/g.62033  ORF Transcript_24893/g.62033 Transcript_24893/m.62033 type:complete len:212 (-) Transcript_24893:205-840(-)